MDMVFEFQCEFKTQINESFIYYSRSKDERQKEEQLVGFNVRFVLE